MGVTRVKHRRGLGGVVRGIVSAAKRETLLTGLVIALSIGAALLPPLVLERIVNRLTARQSIPLNLALEYFGLLALSGLLESGQNVMITLFGQKITHALRSAMCAKLTCLPAAYFTRHEPGEITSRFVNDVDVVDSLFTNGIIGMVADAFKVLSVLAVIFIKSRGLGVMMLLVTPPLFFMTRLFQKRMLAAQIKNRVAVGKVTGHVPETILNIRMIRNLFRQQYMERRYDDYIGESYRATDAANVYDSIYSPIVIVIGSCVIALMMVAAARGYGMQAFFGMSVGTAVAVIAYVGKVFEPLESIGMEIQNIQSAVAGVVRIDEFMQEPERAAATGRIDRNADPCIEFDHVRFAYDDDDPVFDDLSLTVARGEAVTLVGRTGAGKSTAFRLLLGLYSPERGRVLVDGAEASGIPDAEKRKLFGYVEQSFRLVSGTVADQIALFDPAITRRQVEDAARLVGLHENILLLEQGYDTPADKAAFSKGQFQLLSIARAVAAEPHILLLDEITANLDSDTERHVLDALERACAGRTVLSISHRLHERAQGLRLVRIGE